MEKTMQEVLKENQERHRKMIEERIKFEKKKERKETIIVAVASLLIITLLTMVLVNMGDNGSFDKCLNEGHSSNYCARTL